MTIPARDEHQRSLTRREIRHFNEPVPRHCQSMRAAREDYPEGALPAQPGAGDVGWPPQDAAAILGSLSADPAPEVDSPDTMDNAERTLLTLLLRLSFIETREWEEIGAHIPAGCGEIIIRLARNLSQQWLAFAELVEDRALGAPGEA